jgi:DNA-binding CsgD family transcriptional regulator/Spy/CpxP family protein refolding chaperone
MAARPAVHPGATGLTGRRSECGVLDRLVDAVRAGESRALVVAGEPGVGKTALLDYVAGRAVGCRVGRATGVQSEMELAFAGLQQLCAPMLEGLERLPAPQRDALRSAFGLSAGPPPDRFLVGLAVLSLLAEVAGEQPLVCLVDDQQWLDSASAQVLGFAARRLGAESVGLVFAARVPGGDLAGLPELPVAGLPEADARALLDSVIAGPLDARVRDRIVAETRGNPLALLELGRLARRAELAGEFGLPGAARVAAVDESFRRRVDALPAQTRRLLLVAAADPTGDPGLVWQAAGQLGIGTEAATPAAEAGLAEFGTQVRFRHPLARTAAYQSASRQDMQDAHRALAEVTDPQTDPDRRAWHRAQAAPGPDENVAGELEQSADRAQARGGLSAAAAFLERAAVLTPESARRAQRLLAAARAKRDAGALGAALELLTAVEAGPADALRAAEVEHLRGQIAMHQRHGTDAARLLLSAARRLEPLNAALARETHFEALVAAMWAADLNNPGGVREAAEAARGAPRGPQPPRVVDVLLDAFAMRLTEGLAAAAPALAQALELAFAMDVGDDEIGRWFWLTAGSSNVALELWDPESWHAMAVRQVQVARDAGALLHLQGALDFQARTHLRLGELAAAAPLIEEGRLIAEATGNPPVSAADMILASLRGREAPAAELIEATSRDATARGQGLLVDIAAYASALLYNGLGRYDAALDAARQAFEHDRLGYGPFVVPELAEAASRTGDIGLLRAAVECLSEYSRVRPTEWALGLEAGVRAMLSEGEAADRLYRESICHLGRARNRAELARAHLLYGEWLRRERRRGDAREQLRTAHAMLEEMGFAAFAERARRELAATGETARKRTLPASTELTAQEAQVAGMARDGLSNPEIGARLFISARTVEYHLRKAFAKLGISSRGQLHRVLPPGPATAQPR